MKNEASLNAQAKTAISEARARGEVIIADDAVATEIRETTKKDSICVSRLGVGVTRFYYPKFGD